MPEHDPGSHRNLAAAAALDVYGEGLPRVGEPHMSKIAKSRKTYVRDLPGHRPEIMIEVGKNEAVNVRAAEQLGLVGSAEVERADAA